MKNTTTEILALSKSGTQMIPVTSMVAVGGTDCSGVTVEGLKAKDDYVIVTREASGEVLIHALRGRHKQTQTLAPLSPLAIEDLTLIVLPERGHDGAAQSKDPDIYNALIETFAMNQDFTIPLANTLDFLMEHFLFEKGLVIVQQPSNNYEILISQGMAANEAWLSETLVREVLDKKQPLQVQNIVGSRFQSQKSMMATGFLSVFAWPLVLRGQSLGLLLVGSKKPHSGLTAEQEQSVRSLCQVCALFVHFHLKEESLRQQIAALRALPRKSASPFQTLNSKLQDVVEMAGQVAKSELAVLLQGETGVGKEVMAKWIHDQSDRSQKPFIAVNCSAIPENLLESMLFGHKKGAFTGAVSDMVGKFQAAHTGTLFLDEIGDLPLPLQGKLLRALEEKTIEPLGSHRSIRTDVRILAATLKPLQHMTEQKKFRDDLYFRLAEVVLHIPPLRERPEDIALLATEFLKKYAPDKKFSAAAWQWLKTQPWKGNVRELKSAIHRAAVLSPGVELTVRDFRSGVAKSADATDNWLGGSNLQEARDLFTAEKVRQALLRSKGHRGQAADMLGVTIRTLFRYLDDMTDVSHESEDSVL